MIYNRDETQKLLKGEKMELTKYSHKEEKFTDELVKMIYFTDKDISRYLFSDDYVKAAYAIKMMLIKNEYIFLNDCINILYDKSDLLGFSLAYSGEDKKKFILDTEMEKKIKALEEILTSNISDRQMYLHYIYTDKAVRGKGAGSMLMQKVFSDAKDKKCTELLLDVAADNSNAISFYKHKGFSVYEEKKNVSINIIGSLCMKMKI